ncbi:hypothetical protein CRG98_022348 [Punica granatum]|uniref:Uncharacterized protein n=1 Tax=Punica granatum TaxID=22663 RepID=A0A2I0JLU2_PUNGR|nr:hypothetical protein CRG98_022348 [Punica granatum]
MWISIATTSPLKRQKLPFNYSLFSFFLIGPILSLRTAAATAISFGRFPHHRQFHPHWTKNSNTGECVLAWWRVVGASCSCQRDGGMAEVTSWLRDGGDKKFNRVS